VSDCGAGATGAAADDVSDCGATATGAEARHLARANAPGRPACGACRTSSVPPAGTRPRTLPAIRRAGCPMRLPAAGARAKASAEGGGWRLA
jgi:hypothetical protein